MNLRSCGFPKRSEFISPSAHFQNPFAIDASHPLVAKLSFDLLDVFSGEGHDVAFSPQAGIQNSEYILDQLIWRSLNELRLAGRIVDRLDLLSHYKAGQGRRAWQRKMKGNLAISLRDGTNNRESGVSGEEVIANDEGGAPALLLVTGLRIKRDCNEVSFTGDISRH